MGARSRVFVAALALSGLTAAPAVADEYKWTSKTRAFSYTKSVCGSSGDTYIITEVVTQEIFNQASGVSHVGNGKGLPRGSSQSSGRIRRNLSKTVQGPDAAPPSDVTITETLPLVVANWGAINRSGKKLAIDVGLVDDPLKFGALEKGKAITININETSNTPPSDDGLCVTEARGSVTGTLTITRIR